MGNELMVRQQAQVGYVAPRSLADLKELGEFLISQGLAPENIKNGGQAALVIMAGMEIGLPPLYSLSHVYLVRGVPSLSTKVMVKLFRDAGHDYEIDEWTRDRVAGKIILKNGHICEHALTRAECDEAGWTGGKTTWKGAGGKTMLMYRWLSSGIRAFAPECLFGMMTPDEAEDAIPEDELDREATMPRVTVEQPQASTPEPQEQEEPVEAEFTEAAPEPTGYVLTGNETRPYAPEMLKAVIADKIAKYTAERGDRDATKQKRGATAGALNRLFDHDSETVATDKRHSLLIYLLDESSTNKLGDVECGVLLGWAQDWIEEDGARVPVPQPQAVEEARQVIEMLDAQAGQQRLL